MSSTTKIINVLKDDSFAEILNLFKTTPSAEVIFVLPKRSKAFQKEEHFAVLREAAEDVNKTVSFLSSNAEANVMAQEHGFEVLLARAPAKSSAGKAKSKVPTRAPINVVNQIESFYKQPQTEPEPDEAEDEPAEEVEPEVVPVATRRMSEVIHAKPSEHHSVKVSAVKEKSYPVQVHHEPVPAMEMDDDPIEEVWATEQAEPDLQPRVASAPRQKLKMPSKRRMAYTFGGAAVLLAGIFIYMNTGSAQVTINPAVTPLNFNLDAVASETVASVDKTGMKIPGQTFSVNKSVSQTFTATGSKDVAQKSRGTITLYNKTSSAQPLIATTRFESSDGHIFHSLTSVTVPAAKNSSTPGTVDVNVIADKIGPDFNVPAGNFTIPAFKEKGDTVKYQNITGVSTSPMHGGTSGQATVVTQADWDKAKAALTDELKQAINDEAKAETEGLKVLSDSSIAIDPPQSTAQVDDAADTFTMTLSGTLKTAGFKETDLQQLISAYTDGKYHLDIVPDKLTVNYSNVNFDSASNALHMTVGVTGPGYAKIDQTKILSDLLGKKQSQIETYLKAVPNITSANVLLSPVWVRSVPKNSDKVHITVTH